MVRALALVVGTLTHALAASQVLYTVQRLTGMPGDFTARSLTDSGVVAGYAPDAAIGVRGYTWDAGVVTGYSGYPGVRTVANATDGNGIVVGEARVAGNIHHAAVWQRGAFVDLGTIGNRGAVSTALRINTNGWIAGESETLAGSRPFVHHDGAMHNLGSCPDPRFLNGASAGINNSNEVVGTYWDPYVEGGSGRAYYWSEATGITLLMPQWQSSTALGINDLGDIIGTFRGQNYTPYYGFVLRSGSFVDLGYFSLPYAINDSGDIVGTAEFAPVIWKNLIPHKLTSSLTESGWSITRVQDINESGQILAFAYSSPVGVLQEWVLLNPVPEPKTWLAVSTLLFAVLIRMRPHVLNSHPKERQNSGCTAAKSKRNRNQQTH
jgi:uncharacterized membrane protein